MLTVPGPPDPGCRSHPWGTTEYVNDGGAYYDFARSPELIPTVLEDFVPHSHYQAVQRFFEFLRWVATSSESALETNDCALRAPHQHKDFFSPRLRIDGRLHIFYRNHADNVRSDCFRWLERMFYIYLQVYRPDFRNAIVSVAANDTDYIGLVGQQCRSKLLSLAFSAYGYSEADAFASLLVVFDGFWEAAKRISRWVKTEIPDPP
jgi:hypothetical protein